MLKPTDEMRDVLLNSTCCDCGHYEALTALLELAEPQIRAAVAAEIEAALAADQADSDVTSGEAIWEQTGYRRGLAAAARLAAEQTEETP